MSGIYAGISIMLDLITQDIHIHLREYNETNIVLS